MNIALSTTAIGLIVVSQAWVETIFYEIREVPSNEMIADGTLHYTQENLSVATRKVQDRWVSEVLLELEQGFKIGARIFGESDLTGFGLVAELEQGDFSWAWFDHEIGDTFTKRRGYGRVAIEMGGLPGLQQLRSVRFKSDVDVCFKNKFAYQRVEEDTHCIRVLKDSVLRLE